MTEAILAPKAPERRNALCPCGSGKRYKHCHGAITVPHHFSFAPNRFAEFETRFFAAAEASADPAVRLNMGIDRLIMEGKSREATALLIQELPRFLPANAPPAFGMQAATSIQRLVIGNGHYLMQNADALDIEEACGLPVILSDLSARRAMDDLAPGTLVILTGHTIPAESSVLQAIKAHTAGCIAVVWLFDNHHGYLVNAQTAYSADFCFPSHPMSTDYVSHVAPGKVGPSRPGNGLSDN